MSGTNETARWRADATRLARIKPWALGGLRTLLAAVLLVAGVLKAHELLLQPADPPAPASQILMAVVVMFEITLAVWLVTGIGSTYACGVALVTFTAFSAVAASSIVANEPSCGCFGRTHINPWFAFLFDTSAVACLIVSGPSITPRSRRSFWQSQMFGAFVLCVTAIVAAAIADSHRSSRLDASGLLDESKVSVVLEPELWVGRFLPLVKYIDIGPQLIVNNWLVVLYDARCTTCAELLPFYQEMATSPPLDHRWERVALIDVSGATQFNKAQSSAFCGHLSLDKVWRVHTPTEMLVSDGQVNEVSTESKFYTAWARGSQP